MTWIGESTVRQWFEEVEAAEKAKFGVIAQGKGYIVVGTDLTPVDISHALYRETRA